MKRAPMSDEAAQAARRELHSEISAGRLYLHEAARRMRKVLGKTQPEMAKLLGIAQRTYIDFERNVGNPTLETMRRIGCLFGLEVKFGPRETLHDSGQLARNRCRELDAEDDGATGQPLPRRSRARGRQTVE